MRRVVGLAGVMLATLAAVPTMAAARDGKLLVGTASGPGTVRTFGSDLTPKQSFTPFSGGVRVATGDVNGDGRSDIITSAGPGGAPRVRVFDGATGSVVRDFLAFDPVFAGGVTVAAGDLDGDGRAEVVTGAGPGGGTQIRVFQGSDGALSRAFFGFGPSASGGVTVATGDVFGDGVVDLLAASDMGGRIRAFAGSAGDIVADFLAIPDISGPVSIATGRYFGADSLFVGAGAGSAPIVKIYSLADLSLTASFLAFDPGFTGGVNVAAGRLGGRDRLFLGMATGGGSVSILEAGGRGVAARGDEVLFQPFGADFDGGLNVAFLAGAVPEPGIWAQLLAGFGLLGAAQRRLRRGAEYAGSARGR